MLASRRSADDSRADDSEYYDSHAESGLESGGSACTFGSGATVTAFTPVKPKRTRARIAMPSDDEGSMMLPDDSDEDDDDDDEDESDDGGDGGAGVGLGVSPGEAVSLSVRTTWHAPAAAGGAPAGAAGSTTPTTTPPSRGAAASRLPTAASRLPTASSRLGVEVHTTPGRRPAESRIEAMRRQVRRMSAGAQSSLARLPR
jgi:hypothetical protein